MKTMSAAASQLFVTPPAQWKREELERLTGHELELFTRLMAIPHTGTKPDLICRLLDAADLRQVLSVYGDVPPGPYDPATHPADLMASRFSRKELVALARRAGSFYSLPKRGIAVGLLNWRNTCRKDGQKFLHLWREAQREHPRQSSLRLDSQPDKNPDTLPETGAPTASRRADPHAFWLIEERQDKTRRRACLGCGDVEEFESKGPAPSYVTWYRAHLACCDLYTPAQIAAAAQETKQETKAEASPAPEPAEILPECPTCGWVGVYLTAAGVCDDCRQAGKSLPSDGVPGTTQSRPRPSPAKAERSQAERSRASRSDAGRSRKEAV